MTSWSCTAGMPDQPGRFATMAGVWPPSAAWLSARKMICGLAVTMYSCDSSGIAAVGRLARLVGDVLQPEQATTWPMNVAEVAE